MDKKTTFKVDFIGIGVPKAGTSWIYRCLEEHPQICVSKIKETGYFTKNYDKGISWYESLFRQCAPESIKGEYSPGYLHDPATAKRIYEYNPDVKLIACLRNPVDRLISAHNHAFVRGKITQSLEERMEKNLLQDELNRGLYYTHISRFLKFFPKKNMLILIYEDIEQDPEKFIKSIYNFLGVDSNFIPKKLYRKLNVTYANQIKILWLNQLIFKIRIFIKHRMGSTLTKFLKAAGINYIVNKIFKWNRQTKNLAVQKNDIPRKVKNKLHEYYIDENNKLEKLLNRKLYFWHNE